MHAATKLTAIMRKEIFSRWKKGDVSLRELGRKYHVDKKVIQRIVARGQAGDFSVHSSVNIRYLPASKKKRFPKKSRIKSPKNFLEPISK
jgi:hypothetical protein